MAELPRGVVDRTSDEELLRMLRQVEDGAVAAAEALDEVLDAPNPEPEAPHDACPSCGEPAEHAGECFYCREAGCLPPDLWSPGMADPCLTLCVRCARALHWACSAEDEAGNPRCPTCRF